MSAGRLCSALRQAGPVGPGRFTGTVQPDLGLLRPVPTMAGARPAPLDTRHWVPKWKAVGTAEKRGRGCTVGRVGRSMGAHCVCPGGAHWRPTGHRHSVLWAQVPADVQVSRRQSGPERVPCAPFQALHEGQSDGLRGANGDHNLSNPVVLQIDRRGAGLSPQARAQPRARQCRLSTSTGLSRAACGSNRTSQRSSKLRCNGPATLRQWVTAF